ncbi:hypothetical protein B0H16DRAFT_1723647 [Mycena metata]|uniref:RING-type domain-containing protein n=1 Tax=Mycena metata TaxID=1033252 RepID=A0AAD7IZ04_9AGAR|nr:hypothetical protein B0H16DRAFT_1723647 [Mycena metata]
MSAQVPESSVRRPTSLLSGQSPAQVARIRWALGNSAASPATRRLIARQRQITGVREIRDNPLSEQELYLNAARPESLQTPHSHYMCTICSCVKVHPVAYLCGHSNCYICVRLHLEQDWKCPVPQCGQVMRRPPHRHYPEEETLVQQFPGRENGSVVSYCWEGLVFPSALSPATSEDDLEDD